MDMEMDPLDLDTVKLLVPFKRSTASKYRKCCFIPSCPNSTSVTPDKLFVVVPTNPARRRVWMETAGRADSKNPKTPYFCCQDHFDLQRDTINYEDLISAHKNINNIINNNNNKKIRMRLTKTAVPSKFDCEQFKHLNRKDRINALRNLQQKNKRTKTDYINLNQKTLNNNINNNNNNNSNYRNKNNCLNKKRNTPTLSTNKTNKTKTTKIKTRVTTTKTTTTTTTITKLPKLTKKLINFNGGWKIHHLSKENLDIQVIKRKKILPKKVPTVNKMDEVVRKPPPLAAPIKSSQYKKCCYIPSCPNSTILTPEKMFIVVPTNPIRRKIWMRAAGRGDSKNPMTPFFCCQDHFDLENDMINYSDYLKFGSGRGKMRMHLVRTAVPSIFVCEHFKHLPRKERVEILRKLHREIKFKTVRCDDSNDNYSTDRDYDSGSEMDIIDINTIMRAKNGDDDNSVIVIEDSDSD